MKFNKMVIYLSAFVLSVPLFADEVAQANEEPLVEMQEVADRPLLPPPLVPPMPRSENSLSPLIPIKTQRLTFLTADQMILATEEDKSSSPFTSYHWFDSFPEDNVIRLEDGSEWTFNDSESFHVRSWRKGDIVVISPKMHWFGGADYTYTLTNKSLSSSVDVNSSYTPSLYGNHSTWIAGIDYNNGQVFLVNGKLEKSTWIISNSDFHLLKDWKINDHVVIANNDNWMWWFSSFDHAIIHVNLKHYVHAKQL